MQADKTRISNGLENKVALTSPVPVLMAVGVMGAK